MNKHLKLMLGFALAATFTACKKDQTAKDDSPGKLKDRVDLKMTLPGQSNQEVYLQPQANGTYQAAWFGTMTFGDIPHPIVNVQNGLPIPAIEILSPNNEYLEIMTAGPYFVVIRPTFVGDPNVTREEFKKFRTAYEDHIYNRKNQYFQLAEPDLPNMDNYVNVNNTGNGEIIVKGMIVSSTSSPSKMSIVSHTFQPPKPAVEMYYLFPEYIVGNVLYTITGNSQGAVQEVTAEDITTHTPIPVYGYSGSYTETLNGVHVQDLKIWTTPNSFITYTGDLQ
ncbi:hypothetical protein [Pedobacter agri]|uniref:Uncharacterized protein n=1 Tax=Pedobacter agri TaxID=454586 RepID=A0A9X3DFD9_9SPHI|nr:hypothetical protein [Pedobacter agri]MCX3264828.1 hypothetical protein [Pedobacter agri]